MFMENEEFQALWNNVNETFTRLKKVEDSEYNVSMFSFSKTGKSVSVYRSMSYKPPAIYSSLIIFLLMFHFNIEITISHYFLYLNNYFI